MKFFRSLFHSSPAWIYGIQGIWGWGFPVNSRWLIFVRRNFSMFCPNSPSITIISYHFHPPQEVEDNASRWLFPPVFPLQIDGGMSTQIRLTPKRTSKEKNELYRKSIKCWSSSRGKNDHIPSCCIRLFNTRHLLKTFTNSRKSSCNASKSLHPGMNGWMSTPVIKGHFRNIKLRTYHRYIHVVLAVHHLFITPSCSPQRHHLPNQKKTSIFPSIFHIFPKTSLERKRT